MAEKQIDFLSFSVDNSCMSTDVATDLEIICAALASGRKTDPALAQKIRERSEKLRTNTKDQLTLELLREARDE